LISWKDSFEKINNELDSARKKQNALEEMHTSNRISQLTYDNLNERLTTEIEHIEARRKELAEKMTSKLNELERQISTLETFLANVEMSFAASEITEELHSQEVSALNFGLEATKNELDFIKDAILELVPEETQAELSTTIETAETVEATPAETAMETVPEVSAAEPIETPVEPSPVTDETSIEQPAEMIVETPETLEMPETPIETSTEEITSEEQITPETTEIAETPVEMSTEEMTEEITEATTETTVEEATEEIVSEEQAAIETPTEETITEEQVLSENLTDETITEEIVIENPTEETTEEATEEILPEEQIVSETPMEESQPFPEENPED